MTGAGGGGFTGTTAMGTVEMPLITGIPGKKKKDRKTAVREAAQRVVDRLLNDEQADAKTPGTGHGIGRHA